MEGGRLVNMNHGFQRFKTRTNVAPQMPQRREVLDRSLEVICDLQEEDGGIAATRADDAYPFVYPRDGVMMTMAMNRHGLQDRSKRFYRFLNGVRRVRGEVLQRYNKGYPSVSQHNEFDVSPIVLQGIYDTYRLSGDEVFLENMWSLVDEAASFSARSIDGSVGLVRTVRAIHETSELEEGFEVWTNCATVRGLLDASRMAAEVGHPALAEEWRGRSKALMEKVVELLYDSAAGCFIKNIRPDGTRIAAPDVSQLSPFYFGVLDDDSVLERTLNHLKATLWNGQVGGFQRFRDFEVVQDWHWYTGGTGGAWPLFTLWGARFYGRLGMVREKEECLDFVHRSMTEEMCIPEKMAPMSGFLAWKENEIGFNDRILRGVSKAESGRFRISVPDHVAWACPLGWAHAEYLMLDIEEERRREDPALPEVEVPRRRSD